MDDEADFGEFVSIIAQDLGYEVTALTDPCEFKQCYQDFRPDTVVMDMVMPDMNGNDLVNWLISQGSAVKLLIVTGYNPLNARSLRLQGAANGMSPVKTFRKPVSARKLRAALA